MQTHELSSAQLRQLGIEALMQALGAVGMARFLQQFDRGSGNYTHDRTAVLAGITLEARFSKREAMPTPKSSKPAKETGRCCV